MSPSRSSNSSWSSSNLTFAGNWSKLRCFIFVITFIKFDSAPFCDLNRLKSAFGAWPLIVDVPDVDEVVELLINARLSAIDSGDNGDEPFDDAILNSVSKSSILLLISNLLLLFFFNMFHLLLAFWRCGPIIVKFYFVSHKTRFETTTITINKKTTQKLALFFEVHLEFVSRYNLMRSRLANN